jgi:hypothetical protein
METMYPDGGVVVARLGNGLAPQPPKGGAFELQGDN